jgi:hypothetical protein
VALPPQVMHVLHHSIACGLLSCSFFSLEVQRSLVFRIVPSLLCAVSHVKMPTGETARAHGWKAAPVMHVHMATAFFGSAAMLAQHHTCTDQRSLPVMP